MVCLICHHLTITEDLEVNGSISGKYLKCGRLQSNGNLSLEGFQAVEVHHNGSFRAEHVVITGSAFFHGNVHITGGKLRDVALSSPHAVFKDTGVLGNIRVKKHHSILGFSWKKETPSVLELRGNTRVEGDIIFEGRGEVRLFDGAKVLGKVLGATLRDMSGVAKDGEKIEAVHGNVERNGEKKGGI